jgi:hypothetical protein
VTCERPIQTEQWLAYWANELTPAEVDEIDEHVFACDACTREAERVSRVVQAFRASLPPVIGRAELDALSTRGHVVFENEFAPGIRKTALFERGVDFLIHRLRGLDLAGAERVDVTVRSESGETMFVDPFAPFDASRGEVLIACQRHFEAFGHPDVAIDVRVHRGGASTLATYLIPHVFA